MARKKWTPKAEITDDLLKFREKRKWQLALRRYVLEKNISASYAFYFGLTIEKFRKWIELQFSGELSWDNFGSAWQFDHIVPVACFDFTNDDDLRLCWNFINIRVDKIEPNKNKGGHINIIAARPYFEALYERTGFSLCLKMINKIEIIIASNIVDKPAIEDFIIKNKEYLETISSLSREELNNLNMGMSLEDIFLERSIINKFG